MTDDDGKPFEFSSKDDWAQVKYLNEDSTRAKNFSVLGDLEDFRCKDGMFTMLLRWPTEGPKGANIWRQSSNPVTMDEMGVDNYTPIRIDYEDAHFGGLQRTDHRIKTSARCFLDGSCEHHDSWFYAIGVTELFNKGIPGPNSCMSTCVELYITTKDLDFEDETGPKDDRPYCEHGKLKSEDNCQPCKNPLSTVYTLDHCPYYPCTPGHGPRWLWNASERGPGRMTVRSNRFFEDLEARGDRTFQIKKWPVLYNTEFKQNSCNGYHNFQLGSDLLFSGWLNNGLPEGMCSLRWLDGTEYHGEFLDGEMTGYGRFIFQDTSEFRGDVKNGLPVIGLYYPPQKMNDVRRRADYSRLSPTPLWELDSDPSIHDSMPECPIAPFLWTKADCLAVVKSSPSQGPEAHSFDHIKAVTAQLVWARPIYADQPLWNASDCRGKIVAVLRGPSSPAPPCNYSIKLFHAQNAGAVGVIFVDFDSFATFTVVPRVEDGPIYAGGPTLTVRIPCFSTLNYYSGVLQEGALHTMALMAKVPLNMPKGFYTFNCYCRSYV